MAADEENWTTVNGVQLMMEEEIFAQDVTYNGTDAAAIRYR